MTFISYSKSMFHFCMQYKRGAEPPSPKPLFVLAVHLRSGLSMNKIYNQLFFSIDFCSLLFDKKRFLCIIISLNWFQRFYSFTLQHGKQNRKSWNFTFQRKIASGILHQRSEHKKSNEHFETTIKDDRKNPRTTRSDQRIFIS